jgi:protein N-terminal asparagine amidohydrolase
MVLVLNGVLQEECPMDTHSLFMQHPVYRDTANQLLSIPIRTVKNDTKKIFV